jgi:tetratricopeptide (TPR) repeat protein
VEANNFDLGFVFDTIIKLVIFLPPMVLVAWWLFSDWLLEKALRIEEFGVGLALWTIAFCFGLKSILAGGWSSTTIVGLVYLALLVLAVWEYLHWRKVELKHLESEVSRYQRAIAKDPTAIAAYSLLGETYLKLRLYEEAEAALEQAVQMDPESKSERRLLAKARAKEGGPTKWWRTD